MPGPGAAAGKTCGMSESANGPSFGEAFASVVAAIPVDPAFAAVEIVSSTLRPGRTAALSVMIDRQGGVDIATVEQIAARINAALDAFPDTLYTLEVTSAGLERPLLKPADYDRFAGRNVKIITTLLIAAAKTHRGVLVGLRGEDVMLRVPVKGGEAELALPLAAIKTANLEYDLRADLLRQKNEQNAKKRDDR
jgi:ribosome maturation factor RimP